MIESKNVTVKRKGQYILKDLSFEVPSNKITLLYDEMGNAGTIWMKKATNILSKYYIQQGEVFFDGKKLTAVMEDLSVVFEETYFYSDYTVKDNIYFLSNKYNIDNILFNHIKRNLLLEDILLSKKISECTLSQKKIVAITSALIRKPKYLLLDKINVGLDKKRWELVENILLEIKKNTTIVITGSDKCLEEIADYKINLIKGSEM